MRLFSTPNSTYSRRVRIALAEKGLTADIEETPAARRREPEFLDLNPYGRIPVLVDGTTVVYESTAILEYLEAAHPAPALVPPTPAGRAHTAMHVKLCDLEFTHLARAIQRPKRFDPQDTWDEAAFAVARPPLVRHFEHLERTLADQRYLVCDQFTLADLVYIPFMHFHALLELPLPPRVAAWWERLAKRPSVRATEPSQ